MGASRPFLYGEPPVYAFHGPTDGPFNPKAVTQASWVRDKPQRKKPMFDTASNGSVCA